MATTKQQLQEAVDLSISVVYHKFGLNAIKENENKIFCFYEGKDAPYYSFRVSQIYGEDYLNFSCKNKTNVLKLYEKIKNLKYEFSLKFFVDSDFDIKINNPEIYETPAYSIENFYAYKCCMYKILKNEFYLNERDAETTKIILFFQNQLLIYCDQILLFNAWYHSLKQKKILQNLESTNVSLDDKIPNNFLNLEIENISSSYDEMDIFRKYPEAISVTKEEILKSKEFLKQSEGFVILRGKYILTFIIKFLDFLVHDSKNSKKYIKEAQSFQTNKKIILGQISQYAFTPECLIEYLKKDKASKDIAA